MTNAARRSTLSRWPRTLMCAAFVALVPLGCRSIAPRVTPTSLHLPLTSPTSTPTLAAASPLVPSNNRNWQRDLAVLPYAEFKDSGDTVTIHNVRNNDYITEHDYLSHYDDRTYDLNQLETVYFVVVPFNNAPALAHTMLSFEFADGRCLVISVEVRLEQGETYSPLLGALRQFELMYVVADERDVILLRTECRKCDVYMHKARTTHKQVRALFVDMLTRINQLYQQPEFYDTLTNNCTTNIVQHIDNLAPGKINMGDIRVLLPGYSDQLAMELGLLDTDLPLEEARRQARITELAHQYKDDPDFSARIRGR